MTGKITVLLDQNTLKPMSVSSNGRQLISSMSMCRCEKSHRVYPQQRSGGSFGCYSFSSPLTGEAKVDSLPSPDGANEAVLVEGDMQEAVPWWQSFQSAGLLYCFVLQLSVNMSIAILPMSKEFNWNSATVGLMQSSFFYLLTQILGGIGGKLVLGFGVVWWSVATILTPIAARIGLPLLLIMCAYMGIGEVSSAYLVGS
ncbi:hypothetical protein CRYUN_Cryun20dG0026500 [Craigia yunnanensis]